MKNMHHVLKDRKIVLLLALFLVLAAAYLIFGQRNNARVLSTVNPQDLDNTPIPLLYNGLPWEPAALGNLPAFEVSGAPKTLHGTTFHVTVTAAQIKTVSAKVLAFYKQTMPGQDWHPEVDVNGQNVAAISSNNKNGSTLGYVKYAGGKLYGFTVSADYSASTIVVNFSDALKVTPNFPN